MKLLVKLNIVLLTLFAAALAGTAQLSWTLLHRNAQTEIAETARLLMDTALAARSYTSRQIGPLLDTQMKYAFLPQTIPAYSATEIFQDLRQKHPEYSYKEATLNPTNPRDRAVEWEADIINQYRNGRLEDVIGSRETPAGSSFYVSRPIKITDRACLLCHSTLEAAPRTLVERYGTANGFGWQFNEVIGAQIVSVPTSVPLARAAAAFKAFMGATAIVFLVIAAILNFLIWRVVTRPVVMLSNLADRISLGELEVAEPRFNRADEIGVLTRSIGRMRQSLVQAMKMLEA